MRYDGSYKTYKLYSVTAQDIAESGGASTSRLIKNDVLVFLPDLEKPEIGLELYIAHSSDEAKAFIDDRPILERIEKAIERSKTSEQAIEKSRENIERNNIERENERRRKERYKAEYERNRF